MRKRLICLLTVIGMLGSSVNVYAAEQDSRMIEENMPSAEPEETGVEEDEKELLRAGNGIPINAVNFPDENFRQCISEWVDKNQDQVLSEEETGGVTRLELDFRGIEDLRGIEYFTALEYLRVDHNMFSSLDVSKNTALKELYCEFNWDLESLDISKNTALEVLYCYFCGLNNLHMGKNAALETLDCSGNDLRNLEVSESTSLKFLDCAANELSSLDVSKNTALEELSLNNNKVKSLDLSKNTMLGNLDCGFNELSSLDVSKNTALKELYCQDNNLSSLDLSKNTVLEKWNCSGNSFFDQNGTIDMSQRDSGFISSKVSNLQNLSLEGNTFTRPDGSKDGTYDYDCGRNIAMTVTVKRSESEPIPSPKPDLPEDWPFSDVEVKPGYWKYDSIKYVYDNNIMNGINGTMRFDPDEPLTRAMFATVLYRMAGNPAVQFQNKFEDVKEGKYYSNAVIWAYEQGIVQGLDGGRRYGIDEFITREQIAKMLNEFGRVQGYTLDDSTDIGGFPDYGEVSGWAVNYMKWAVGSGMVTGKNIDGVYYLDPRSNATRAECAAMLTRFMNRYQ